MQPKTTPVGSQTLERGLAVLVEIGRHAEGRSTAQLAAGCALHRSITRRLLVSLERTGFARRDEQGRYHLGPAMAAFPNPARPALDAVAEPILERLAAQIDATCTLVEVRADAAVTTLVAEPPTDGPRFSYRVGSRDPLDRGAGGVAALASGPARPREPRRVTSTRDLGYVQTFAELNPGVHGLAAPLPGWEVLASLNVVTNSEDACRRAVGPLLAAAAELTGIAGSIRQPLTHVGDSNVQEASAGSMDRLDHGRDLG